MVITRNVYSSSLTIICCQHGHYQERRNETSHNYTLVEPDLSSRKNLLTAMWWRIIFSENAENSHVKHRDLADEDFSFEFAHFVGLAVWAVYQIMVSIIMLNILIAIM